MTPAGLAKITYPNPAAQPEGKPEPVRDELTIPTQVEKALRSDKTAWRNFLALAPSQRRMYVRWLASAKKQETLDRRVREAIELLRQNKKLGLN